MELSKVASLIYGGFTVIMHIKIELEKYVQFEIKAFNYHAEINEYVTLRVSIFCFIIFSFYDYSIMIFNLIHLCEFIIAWSVF